MFTPFLANVKEAAAAFEAYARKSASKDSSYVTGWFRDTTLSTLQQKYAKEIADTLNKINPAQSTDQNLFTKLAQDMSRIKRLTEGEVKRVKQNDTAKTEFLCELELFNTRVSTAYRHFSEYGLIDVKHESTPLVLFKTALIEYLVYRAIYRQALANGYFTLTSKVRGATFDQELAAKKETLVLSYLNRRDLQDNKRVVSQYINDLLQRDQAILETKTKEGTLPVSFGPLSTGIPISFIYSPNKLTEILTHTSKALESSQFDDAPVMQLTTFLREDHQPPPPAPVRREPASDSDDDDFQDAEEDLSNSGSTATDNPVRLTQATLAAHDANNDSDEKRTGAYSVTYSEDGDSQKSGNAP